MKKTIDKLAAVAAIIFCSVIIMSSCKKDDDNTSNGSSQVYFSGNVINRDLLLSFAKDNNTDVTSKFTGYNFRLTDTASLAGTIAVSNDLLSVKGTWTIDANYDKIIFGLPTNVFTDLALLNKEWQFTGREPATTKLTATNGEADELHFSKK